MESREGVRPHRRWMRLRGGGDVATTGWMEVMRQQLVGWRRARLRGGSGGSMFVHQRVKKIKSALIFF